MSYNVLTNPEVIERLMLITNSKSASDLARKLGTERQNLKSYENKKTTDLNTRIISLLLEYIDSNS
jgi:transcriptional regulator